MSLLMLETRATIANYEHSLRTPPPQTTFVYYHIIYLKSLQSRHHLEGAIPLWGYFY